MKWKKGAASLTTIFSNSARAQTLFPGGLASGSVVTGSTIYTLVMGHAIQVPCSGIDINRMYTGQTEPPLVVVLKGGAGMGLNDTDYTILYNQALQTALTGTVTANGAVDLSFNADNDPVFTYNWVTGDVQLTGAFKNQFRVVRNADGYTLFQDEFLSRRYRAI